MSSKVMLTAEDCERLNRETHEIFTAMRSALPREVSAGSLIGALAAFVVQLSVQHGTSISDILEDVVQCAIHIESQLTPLQRSLMGGPPDDEEEREPVPPFGEDN